MGIRVPTVTYSQTACRGDVKGHSQDAFPRPTLHRYYPTEHNPTHHIDMGPHIHTIGEEGGGLGGKARVRWVVSERANTSREATTTVGQDFTRSLHNRQTASRLDRANLYRSAS